MHPVGVKVVVLATCRAFLDQFSIVNAPKLIIAIEADD